MIEYQQLENLSKILEQEKPRTIFLVTGKSSYQQSGARQRLDYLLHQFNVVQFTEFESNPKLEHLEQGISLLRAHQCDLVLAIGGGSALDIAKTINIIAAHDGDTKKYVRGELPFNHKGKPLVAIPTTAGTGSEATFFAVVYIDKTKYSVGHQQFTLPDYAILDPSLTYTLPPAISASTGMDALCQAIEAYWSILSTPEVKHYAREAISLIFANLPTAVNNPTPEARIAMMQAAHLAGKAINIARTTACHSVSYPFTSYFNIPHGHAVALTMPEIFVFNSNINRDANDQRGTEYVIQTMNELIQICDCSCAEQVKTKIEDLIDNIGLERKLRKLGLTEDKHLQIILDNGFNPERVKNNPRLLTRDQLAQILQRLR